VIPAPVVGVDVDGGGPVDDGTAGWRNCELCYLLGEHKHGYSCNLPALLRGVWRLTCSSYSLWISHLLMQGIGSKLMALFPSNVEASV